MAQLICIGEMVIDFLPGDAPGVYLRNAGGAPANVAIAAARNGISSAMITKVGKDDFGAFLFDTLKEDGVEILSPVQTEEAVTTLAFVSLSAAGERSFTFGRKPGADMFLSEEDVPEEALRQAVILHAGSFSLSAPSSGKATVHAVKTAHEAGKIVAFDVNYRNVAWNDDSAACAAEVEKLLPFVDLIKLSDEETPLFGGEEKIPELMQTYGIAATVVTRGAEGASLYFSDSRTDVSVSVPEEYTVVDTTGAGDAFWGGFLSKLLMQGVTEVSALTKACLEEAVTYGNAAGAICVTGKGAIRSLPTGEAVEAFLARQDRERGSHA